MRKALVASSLLALLLGGCASNPADLDVSGTWINQAAIDAAAKGGPLREALQSYGPNWRTGGQHQGLAGPLLQRF